MHRAGAGRSARVRSVGGSRVRTLEILVILESDGRLAPAAEGEDRIVS